MNVAERLAEIRESIVAENVSWGELAELTDLAEHIDPGDPLLLEWAGVPEFDDDDNLAKNKRTLGYDCGNPDCSLNTAT